MRADLETDIRAAHSAGFDYVEIWAAKLRKFLKERSVGDLRNILSEYSQTPLSINSIEHITFRDRFAYQAIKQECEELSGIAAEIGCQFVVVVPGRLPPRNITQQEVIAETTGVLSELCDISARHNVKLAFEFLGQTDCSVQTLNLASEIVQEVARENVGIVIDSFHFYTGGSTVQMIEALDADSVYLFHINDAEDRPREELNDSHRLLPGSGILPLREIVSALRKIGYDRVASVELFRPSYWEMDPFELAKEAYKATTKVLQ
jgi:2-keto-myo-inositol isomerase